MAEIKKVPVLGTGLSGLIGSRFQNLYQGSFDFHNLDLSTGIDITDASAVDQAVQQSKAATIIHLAAFTNVSAAHSQQNNKHGLCYTINVTGTKTIAEAASRYGKHLIHISTDFVFDGTKNSPYVETDEPHPIEWYGETKYIAEQVVQELLPQDSWTILRLAYPYQAHPSRPDFLAGIIEKLSTNTLPPAFTDHVITPTFVDDLANIFAYCISHRPSGIFHATGSSSHTDYEIATMVNKVFKLGREVKAGSLDQYLQTYPRPYQKTMRVSNAKLQSEFKMHIHGLKDGLQLIYSMLKSV